DRAFRVCVPGIKVVNTIGCGDSMVAGVALVLAKGLDLKEALRLGAACGVNNAQYQGIGVVNRDEVYKLTEEIRIEEI
ncbi:MAG TPA: PfkB family carbohydrate kinase, partial [Acetivibrio clariflavus]|nr:PfkB family carbohydrate kinase [Acetivibrio clariflavus]